MLARTHNIIAFAGLSSVVVYFAPTEIKTITFVLSLVANAVGALLPDIDQASNKLWDLLPFGDTFAKYFNKAFLNHRGLTHSIVGFILIDKIARWLLPMILNGLYIDIFTVYVALMVGYISHLIADSLTEEGLPLLFPLKYKFGFPPIKSWRIKTGGWFENIIVTPLLIFYILWVFVVYWPIFSHLIG
jgi:inner membrane protein